MAEPKCPQCAVEGTAKIVSKASVETSKTGEPWFYVVHCDDCGHVYNIISKHQFERALAPKVTIPSIK